MHLKLTSLTLLHSERPKLYAILVFMSAIGLIFIFKQQLHRQKTVSNVTESHLLGLLMSTLERRIYSPLESFSSF